MSWDSSRFPARRAEAHFGDRVVEYFTESPRHFYQLLSDTARLYPDKEGLVFADQRLSWADLDKACLKAAAALAAQGISRGDRVGMPCAPKAAAAFKHALSKSAQLRRLSAKTRPSLAGCKRAVSDRS